MAGRSTTALWPSLKDYLIVGRLEIDNNLVENVIRPTALRKKNWLSVGEAEAADRGAILYTIIESCRGALSRMPTCETCSPGCPI